MFHFRRHNKTGEPRKRLPGFAFSGDDQIPKKETIRKCLTNSIHLATRQHKRSVHITLTLRQETDATYERPTALRGSTIDESRCNM
jgi:hypothetical protein